MNVLNNITDYYSGNVNKDKASSLATASSEVIIEDNWKGSIKAYAFEGNTNLVSLNTNEITVIEDGALKDCTRLNTLIMPNIEKIGNGVFENCINLLKVDVKDEEMAEIIIKKLIEDGPKQRIDIHIKGEFIISTQKNHVCLFGDKMSKLITGNEFTVPTYYITRGLESAIPTGAFEDPNGIKKLDVNTATVVEDYAFTGCQLMKKIYLLNLKEIGTKAFAGCGYLSDVYVNGGIVGEVKEALANSGLPQQVFIHVDGEIVDYLYTRLTDMIIATSTDIAFARTETAIPDIYTEIADEAFFCMGTIKLNTNNVTVIGRDVFRGCWKLEELYLPKVETIGEDFCHGCRSLRKIVVKNEQLAITIYRMLMEYVAILTDIDIFIGNDDQPFCTIKNSVERIANESAQN